MLGHAFPSRLGFHLLRQNHAAVITEKNIFDPSVYYCLCQSITFILFFLHRKFFLSQFGDGENLDETGILEMDLAQLSIEDSAGDQQEKSKYETDT